MNAVPITNKRTLNQLCARSLSQEQKMETENDHNDHHPLPVEAPEPFSSPTNERRHIAFTP